MTEVAKTEFYIVCYKRLLYSTHIVRHDTGKEIKISMEIAMLYGYMHDQYNSYTKKGFDFFESLESIGRKFKGIDRRTVKKMIDVLNALGLVTSVKQKQKEHGYDRYHHTVFEFTEIAKNLLFYGPENISGMPLADGMLIRALEKKRPRGKAKTQKSAQLKTEEKYNVKPEQREQANEHAEPTKIIVGERKPVHLVDGRDDVDISRADVQVNSGSSDKQLFPPENHPAEIPIFDQYSSLPFDESLAVFIDDENKVKSKQQRKEVNKGNYGTGRQETVAMSTPVNSGEHEPVMENDSNANLSSYDKLDNENNAVQLAPWDGDSFLPSGQLAPNSRNWAQSQGANDWKEELRMVWRKTGTVVDDKIEKDMEGRCPDDIKAHRKQDSTFLECVGHGDSDLPF
ncbi:DUF6945 domain-containing protein [Yersinia alsatica]|uniref:DUF6945 domain-containing protein n=1 Tax=Yersinia alsatica TaxID=2890317 RepID=UPI0011AA4F02|nr:hypothetical protein [Yersinia alsatica]